MLERPQARTSSVLSTHDLDTCRSFPHGGNSVHVDSLVQNIAVLAFVPGQVLPVHNQLCLLALKLIRKRI